MSADTRKGTCPTVFAPMASGDGLIVRVKPPGGRLRSTAARALAKVSTNAGNGTIELTNRANLQVRGLRPDSVDAVRSVVLEFGLAARDPVVELVRNVMVAPLGAPDAEKIAQQIEAALASEPALRALPPKFGFLVDGAGSVPFDSVSADIGLRWRQGRILLTLDGCDRAGIVSAHSEVVRRAVQVARAFVALPGSPHRMRDADGTKLLANASLTTEDFALAPPITTPVGARPGYVGAGIPFGSVEAEALSHLADLADIHGDGQMRLTPWRTLILTGIRDACAVVDALANLGFATRPDDPLMHIAACVGAPRCASATVATRDDARLLAATGFRNIHVSGCAKGCAQPRNTAATLVGTAGRYDLVRNGRAGDAPSLRDIDVAQAAAALRAGQP